MKKKSLFLVVIGLFLCMSTSFAQNTLNIHQKDGTIVSYGFSEKPKVTYTEKGIHLVTSRLEVDYPMTNLDRFTFADGETKVEQVRTEQTKDDVLVYGTNGVLLKTVRQSNGAASFSTADLPSGNYIIKNGKTTYKITKR